MVKLITAHERRHLFGSHGSMILSPHARFGTATTLEHTHQLSGATGNNVYVWVYNGTSARTEHVVYFWSNTSMFSCFTGYTAWILQHLDIYGSLLLFGLIATFALWVFYGRFGCLLLLVWKTWQHSVLGLQYLTWQLMSTSIVGSFNGKNWINQQVTILVCTHRCYVYVRVPRVPIPLLLAAIF